MTDKLILDNYLLVLKSDVEVFVHGTLESSNDDVRNVLNNALDTILKLQANTYDKMCEYGYYKVCNITCEDIKKIMNS